MTSTKAEGGNFANFLAGIVAIVKPSKAPPSADALDELAYRERVNARAAARRAENAAIVDALLGRPRWLGYRGRGWLKSRAEREAERADWRNRW